MHVGHCNVAFLPHFGVAQMCWLRSDDITSGFVVMSCNCAVPRWLLGVLVGVHCAPLTRAPHFAEISFVGRQCSWPLRLCFRGEWLTNRPLNTTSAHYLMWCCAGGDTKAGREKAKAIDDSLRRERLNQKLHAKLLLLGINNIYIYVRCQSILVLHLSINLIYFFLVENCR